MLKAIVLGVLLTVSAMDVAAAVKVEKTEYKGWKNCYRVTNGEIEAIVTADVGPRVIRFGFVGGQNLFKEFADQIGKSGEKDFQLRGGSRVWKAPEDPVATWAPDNVPVNIKVTANGLIATAPVEPLTKLQKEIEIEMEPSGNKATVTNRITNHGLFALEFSPWVLTMMAPGGMVVSGFPPRGTHPKDLEVTNPLAMWAYTDLSDPRLKFTKKYLTMRQDPNNSNAEKIGTFNKDTWAAYLLNGEAFVKRYTADPSATYPDFGCSFETFTDNQFLEIETLGPMTKVAPEHRVTQVEQWSLHRNVKPAAITDEELAKALDPILK